MDAVSVKKIIEKLAFLSFRKKYKGSNSPESAPIFRLPIDVLLLVFLCGQSDHDAMQESFASIPSNYGRTLASVCQLWRQLAISTARLWTNISLENPRYASELLKRTKEAPIRVSCTCPSQPSQEPGDPELLSRCIDRMQNLRVVVEDHFSDQRLWNFLPRPQALQGLEILGKTPPASWTATALSKSIPLDKMTSLRRLSLQSICLQQDLPFLPMLEHFILWDTLYSRNLNDASLLRSFSNIPNVQFVDVVVPKISPLPGSQAPVHLPRLQSLKLVFIDISVSSIFLFLTFPTTATVNITNVYDMYSHPKTLGMISLFSSYRDHPATEMTLYVGIHNQEQGKKTISLMLKADDSDCPLLLSAPLSRNTLSGYIYLFSSLPDKVRTLEFLSAAKDPSIADWVVMSSFFPSLRKLVLMGSGGVDFLRKYTKRYLWDDDPHSAVNPQLSQLAFNMVDFEVRGEKTDEFEALVASLDQVKRAGLPLESISLVHCGISQGSVTKLEERIPVMWDGPKANVLV